MNCDRDVVDRDRADDHPLGIAAKAPPLVFADDARDADHQQVREPGATGRFSLYDRSAEIIPPKITLRSPLAVMTEVLRQLLQSTFEGTQALLGHRREPVAGNPLAPTVEQHRAYRSAQPPAARRSGSWRMLGRREWGRSAAPPRSSRGGAALTARVWNP